jgi:hypothetical protein
VETCQVDTPAPDAQIFRLLFAGLLLRMGLRLVTRTCTRSQQSRRFPAVIEDHRGLALAAGLLGGIYGVGGGFILGPILVGHGVLRPPSFFTFTAPGNIASHRISHRLRLGYLGAWLQLAYPHRPETAPRSVGHDPRCPPPDPSQLNGPVCRAREYDPETATFGRHPWWPWRGRTARRQRWLALAATWT